MPDPIPPPAAARPEEALELAAQALSDGDLEAAFAQYEPGARLLTWQPGPDEGVRGALTCFMSLRLPLAVRIDTVLRAGGVALVSCARHTTGTGPDGEDVEYRGLGAAVVRAQPDGTWLIAADVWALDGGTAPLDLGTPDHPAPRATEIPL
jgi:ketosteroid isomerase-like protein